MQVDGRKYRNLAEAYQWLGMSGMLTALASALNHTGKKAKTQAIRGIARQAGTSYGRAKSVTGARRATRGNLEYQIIVRDKPMSLKEFRAKQTPVGVKAAPWAKAQTFRSAFIVKAYGGEVYVRTSDERGPLKKLHGPILPNELLREDQPHQEAFKRLAAHDLPERIQREVDRRIMLAKQKYGV